MDGDTKGLQRPGMADVLVALTTNSTRAGWAAWPQDGIAVRESEALLLSRMADGSVQEMGWAHYPWITTDPREATECLQTRGLAPEDDERRGFVSTGTMTNGALCDVPDHMPDLVAWASLGIPAILRAEELARETVARLRPWGCPQTERVVWRVGERREAFAIILPCGLAIRCNGTIGRDVIQPTDETLLASVIRLRRDEGNAFKAVWQMGLALDSITADAVTLVVPVVGAT